MCFIIVQLACIHSFISTSVIFFCETVSTQAIFVWRAHHLKFCPWYLTVITAVLFNTCQEHYQNSEEA